MALDLQTIREFREHCARLNDWAQADALLASLEPKIDEPAAQYVSALVRSHMEIPCAPDSKPDAEVVQLLVKWPDILQAFANDPAAERTVQTVEQFLTDPSWPTQLDPDELQLLGELLRQPASVEGAHPQAVISSIDEWSENALLTLEDHTGDDVSSAAPRTHCDLEHTETLMCESQPESAAVTSTLSPLMQEMFALLATEAAQLIEAIGCDDWYASGDAQVHSRELLDEQLERLRSASQALEFDALATTCEHIQHAFSTIPELNPDPAQVKAVQEAAESLFDYLCDPCNRELAENLARLCSEPTLDAGGANLDITTLAAALAQPPTEIEDDSSGERPSEATEEDVSLECADDVDPSLLDGLLQELPMLCADFNKALQELSDGDEDAIDRAQRAAHTMKGAANTVGIHGIASLAHHAEDILLALARANAAPIDELHRDLVDTGDCTEQMCEHLLGTGSAPSNAVEVLQRILDWANKIDAEGIAVCIASENAPLLQTQFIEDQSQPNDLPGEERGALAQPNTATDRAGAAPTQSLRVDTDTVDEIMRVVAEGIILSGQVKQQIDDSYKQLRSLGDQCGNIEQLAQALESEVDLNDISNSAPGRSASIGSEPSDGDLFDSLEFDRYNELHTLSRQLIEAATDAREMTRAMTQKFFDLRETLAAQTALNRESQEVVMHTRMVEASTIVPRLQRSVRQTARMLDKQVDLECSGAGTLVDTDVLQAIAEPLMHLLRNAVDHGIESPDLRRNNGKPEQGRISVLFAREAGHIVIRCQDDGAGVNLDQLRAKAVKIDLLTQPQADRADERELLQLLFRHGFSTRSVSSQISGRGIGLDVVHAAIAELNGSVEVRTNEGVGCEFELRLPVTLIAAHALLVKTADRRFAITNRALEQIVHPSAGKIIQSATGWRYATNDDEMPLVELGTLLGHKTASSMLPMMHERGSSSGHENSVHTAILIVNVAGARQAVLVDEVVDSKDLVVKSLGRFVKRPSGVSGATILGDGSVAPVLDLAELVAASDNDACPKPSSASRKHASQAVTQQNQAQKNQALIVDDSVSARRTLSQLLSDCGYEVRVARDGIEAIELMREFKPKLLLVDLEMPRMNGLELTSHVRSQADLGDLPIIMISSRSTAKHRKQAAGAGVSAYLTKPYAEDLLLDTISQTLATASG